MFFFNSEKLIPTFYGIHLTHQTFEAPGFDSSSVYKLWGCVSHLIRTFIGTIFLALDIYAGALYLLSAHVLPRQGGSLPPAQQ